MARKLKFNDICKTLAAVRCRQAGQPTAKIAKSAGVAPSTVQHWIRKGGFKRRGGKLRHVAESRRIVDALLETGVDVDDLGTH